MCVRVCVKFCVDYKKSFFLYNKILCVHIGVALHLEK